MTKVNLKNILTAVRDIINRSSEIGIRKAQAAEKQAYNAQAAAETAQSTANNAQSTAEAARSTANNAQSTAEAARSTANNALPLSGGVIQISGGSQFAILTLKEFAGSTGTQKRGIQISGSGTYGNPTLEVTHDDITIYDEVLQRRIGGLNSEELFLKSKNSNKIFKITVDDTGTLSATEVTA